MGRASIRKPLVMQTRTPQSNALSRSNMCRAAGRSWDRRLPAGSLGVDASFELARAGKVPTLPGTIGLTAIIEKIDIQTLKN